MLLRISEAYRVPSMVLIALVLAYFVQYAFNVAIAHAFGPEIYGDFGVAVRVLNLVIVMILFGTNITAKRYLPRFSIYEDTDNIKCYLFWNFNLFIVTSSITLIAVTAVIIFMISFHIYDVQRIEEYHLALYMLYIAPIMALIQLIGSVLIAFRYYVMPIYLTKVLFYLLMLLLLFIMWGMAIRLHSITIVEIFLIANLFVLSIVVMIVKYFIPNTIDHFYTNVAPTSADQKHRWLLEARRLALSGIISRVIIAADVFIIEIVTKNEKLVGFYVAALTISGFVSLIKNGFNNFLGVQISKISHNESSDQLQKILSKANYLQTAITVIVIVMILTFSRELLLHFGATFSVVKWPLVVLVIGTGVGVITKPAVIALMYSGYEKKILQINVIQLTILLVFCPIATYYFGILGTSVVTAGLIIFGGVYIAILAKQYLKIKSCGLILI